METLICKPLLSATPPLLERLVEPNVGLEKAIEARTHVTANRSEARPCIRECPERGATVSYSPPLVFILTAASNPAKPFLFFQSTSTHSLCTCK